MKFRLTYEGRLATFDKASPEHKHCIRRQFHLQLKTLWETHPVLARMHAWSDTRAQRMPDYARKHELAERFALNGYNFVPLVLEELKLLCRLDILFLRPELPGQAVHAGDMDKRISTLFDALRMPQDKQQLGTRIEPEDDEKPFFVLLQDDRLVSHLSVETDMLLQPPKPDAGKQNARLVITVELTPFQRMTGTFGF